MLVHYSLRINLIIKCTVLFLLVLLTACGGGADKSQLNVGSGELVIEFPNSLERHLTDSMQVKATLTLDNTVTYSLNVDKASKKVTGTISNIANGKHLLVVEYLTVQNGIEYSIAKSTINIDVGDIEIVSLAYGEFVYSDNDNDGITNIAELQIGTNPFDSTSIPPSDTVHGSANYSIRDQPVNDSLIIGISQSTNYKIQ